MKQPKTKREHSRSRLQGQIREIQREIWENDSFSSVFYIYSKCFYLNWFSVIARSQMDFRRCTCEKLLLLRFDRMRIYNEVGHLFYSNFCISTFLIRTHRKEGWDFLVPWLIFSNINENFDIWTKILFNKKIIFLNFHGRCGKKRFFSKTFFLFRYQNLRWYLRKSTKVPKNLSLFFCVQVFFCHTNLLKLFSVVKSAWKVIIYFYWKRVELKCNYIFVCEIYLYENIDP